MTDGPVLGRDRSVPVAARVAGLLYVVLGLGFGIAAAIALAFLARHRELPMTPWGFHLLEGPLTRVGRTGTMTAAGALVAVCAADGVSGVGLWRGRRWAGRIGLAATPMALLLGLGFELPFLVAGVPLRAALVLAAWRRLV